MSTPLKHFLAEIATDPDKLAEFQRNPDEVMHEAGLSAEDIAAIKSRSPAALEARLDGRSSSPGTQSTWPAAPCGPQGYPLSTPWSYPVAGGAMPGVCVVIYATPPAPSSPFPLTYFPLTPQHPLTYAPTMPFAPGSPFPLTYSPFHAHPVTYAAIPPGGQWSSGSGPFPSHIGGPLTYIAVPPQPAAGPGRPSSNMTSSQQPPSK